MGDYFSRLGMTDGPSKYRQRLVQYPVVVDTDDNSDLVNKEYLGQQCKAVREDAVLRRCQQPVVCGKDLCYYHEKVHKRLIKDYYDKRS